MKRPNIAIGRPLCEVEEASWKQKMQRDRLLSTGEQKWKNKSVPEHMVGGQRVWSRGIWLTGSLVLRPDVTSHRRGARTPKG